MLTTEALDLDGAHEVVLPAGEGQAGTLHCLPFSEEDFQTSKSWLWVLWRVVPVVTGTGSGIWRVQAQIHPSPPPTPGSHPLPP